MAYSFAQLESFAIQGGFPPAYAPTMAAIALAESSGNNVVQQGQPYGSTGWGLWQITPGNSAPQFGVDQALLNPVANAQAAHWKWVNAGGNEAALRSQWTTYASGKWLTFMPAGAAPPPGNDGSASSAGPGSGSGGGGIVSDILSPIVQPFEHMFDVAINNIAYVLVVAAGVGMIGVGLVLMLKESPAGTTVISAVGGAARTVARRVTP